MSKTPLMKSDGQQKQPLIPPQECGWRRRRRWEEGWGPRKKGGGGGEGEGKQENSRTRQRHNKEAHLINMSWSSAQLSATAEKLMQMRDDLMKKREKGERRVLHREAAARRAIQVCVMECKHRRVSAAPTRWAAEGTSQRRRRCEEATTVWFRPQNANCQIPSGR